MKKTKSGANKKSPNKKSSNSKNSSVVVTNDKALQKKQYAKKPVQSGRKKTVDSKGPTRNYITIVRQFLREAKIELKKVKWPTKKELIASTAVVIFISLFMAFYFWLVDMGLMAIIRNFFA